MAFQRGNRGLCYLELRTGFGWTTVLRKSGLLILAAAFGGFFLVLFIVFEVLDTEFFRGDPAQGGSASPIVNEKTELARSYCSKSVAQLLRVESAQLRGLPDYTAWDIGFDRYLVKASVDNPARPGQSKTYICKVLDQRDASPENWVVQSVEFLD